MSSLHDALKNKPKKSTPRNRTIEFLFSEIENILQKYVTYDFDETYIDSLREQYEEKGFLTDKQIMALQNILDGLERFYE